MARTFDEPKDPEEVRDYGINWLGDIGEHDIVSSVWTGVAGTVVIDQDTFDNDTTDVDGLPAKAAIVRLSGGTLGETCQLLNHIVLSNGEEAELTCKLRIRAK